MYSDLWSGDMKVGDLVLAVHGMHQSDHDLRLWTGKSTVCKHLCHVGNIYRIERVRTDGTLRVRNTSGGLTNTGCTKCFSRLEDVPGTDEFSFMEW